MLLQSIIIILGFNFLGFLYAWFKQSDKGTDLIYNLTFLCSVIVFYVMGEKTMPSLLLTIAISLWAIRLGVYLFWRIHKMDKDERFDDIRVRISSLVKFWVLQTLSIFIILIPAIFFYYNPNDTLIPLQYLGLGIWFIGFVIESIADYQKSVFKADISNKGQFINSGLWSVVRHPNYTGEILCWIGIFLFCVPALAGWQWVSLVSPIWISTLLIFISGIPLLEKAYKTKYGSMPSYKKYVQSTYRLFPYLY